MNIFQRIGNALSRFMYGRNGADPLGLTTIWAVIVLDVINMFLKNTAVHTVLSVISTVLAAWVIFRVFSRNLYKRREENRKFMEKVGNPVRQALRMAKTKGQDKEHKYFTCASCRAVCRVPRGKGKIVITCPKCGNQIHGKS